MGSHYRHNDIIVLIIGNPNIIFVFRSLLVPLTWVHDSGCGCGIMSHAILCVTQPINGIHPCWATHYVYCDSSVTYYKLKEATFSAPHEIV